ncbi:MAG: hypothetical protein V7647_3880, partial [Acidobacteriota bacterium]
MSKCGVLLGSAFAAFASLVVPRVAAAQSPAARVEVRLEPSRGDARVRATAVRVELRSAVDPSQSWSV